MSIHPSLALSDKDKKQRSVLKRTERLRIMLEKGQWKEGDKVYGLPKIKTVRIKIKKEKAEKAEAITAEGATTATATETAKEQPSATKPAAKSTEKK
ncbi:MAG: small basic protein [Candidatus Omnitrophica bacterium]|nr:small basic protein [Candidatus Omnitrophota bacterium]